MTYSEKILRVFKVLDNNIVNIVDGDISSRNAAQYNFAKEIVKLFSIPGVINCTKCETEYKRGIEDGKIIEFIRDTHKPAEQPQVNWDKTELMLLEIACVQMKKTIHKDSMRSHDIDHILEKLYIYHSQLQKEHIKEDEVRSDKLPNADIIKG